MGQSLPDPMESLHSIRYKHYEETRNLPKGEWIRRVNEEAKEIVKKYKIRLRKGGNFV